MKKKLLKNLKHILMMIIFMIKIKGQKKNWNQKWMKNMKKKRKELMILDKQKKMEEIKKYILKNN